MTTSTEIRGEEARTLLAARARRLWEKVNAAGNGDHPLAQLVLKEAQQPSYNMVSWSPETGAVFDWYVELGDEQ
ncbi:MAG: hypothetical protein R3E99_00065 [Burkholderiaceae bacterium]